MIANSRLAKRFTSYGRRGCARCGMAVKKSRVCSTCRRFFGLLGDGARRSVRLIKRKAEKLGTKTYRSPVHS